MSDNPPRCAHMIGKRDAVGCWTRFEGLEPVLVNGRRKSDETDPDRLHDLLADLDGAQVHYPDQAREFVKLYLDGAARGRLGPILDWCVEVHLKELDEDGQVRFKGAAKAFGRAYAFLSSILPYRDLVWEERSIFLHFLIPELPAPEAPDLSKGILERIDINSYRVEALLLRTERQAERSRTLRRQVERLSGQVKRLADDSGTGSPSAPSHGRWR